MEGGENRRVLVPYCTLFSGRRGIIRSILQMKKMSLCSQSW